MMKNLFAMALLLMLLHISGTARADSGYCGDDICGTGETCSNCNWDCGICPNETGTAEGPR